MFKSNGKVVSHGFCKSIEIDSGSINMFSIRCVYLISLSISDTDVHIVSSERWLLSTSGFCKWPDVIDGLFSRSRYLELPMELSHAPLFIKTNQTILLFIYLLCMGTCCGGIQRLEDNLQE